MFARISRVLAIAIVGSILFPAEKALAGGEDYFGLSVTPSACYRAGYFRTPIRKGSRCTLAVYNSYGAMNYWIQYQNAGSTGWKNLTTKRSWIDGNGDGQEDTQIRVTTSRYYRVVGDFNGNGFPDKTSEASAIFVK